MRESKSVVWALVLLFSAACSVPQKNPWYLQNEYIAADVTMAAELLAKPVPVSQQPLDAEVAVSGGGSSCIYSDAGITDPWQALVFFVFVQMPICAVAGALDSSEGEHPESANAESIEHADNTAPLPIEIASDLESHVNSVMRVHFMTFVGGSIKIWQFPDSAESITVHIRIDELQFLSIENSRNYQLVMGAYFCIDDQQFRFEPYADRAQEFGTAYTREKWLQKDAEEIKQEFQRVTGRLARRIQEILTEPVSKSSIDFGNLESCAEVLV